MDPPPPTPPRPPPPPIGETLVSARSAREYEAMFDVDLDRLARRRVLDCPGGASSFVAELGRRGGDAVAVDPVYAMETGALVRHVRADAARGHAYSRANADRFVHGPYFRDADHHDRERDDALETWAADYVSAGRRYRAASLPDLPFADGEFDLAVCSHLLFTYDDRLDLEFHVRALKELLRVAHEVRVFPTLSMTFARSTFVEPLLEGFRHEGVIAGTRTVPYEFQRGGNEMLVLWRRPPGLRGS